MPVTIGPQAWQAGRQLAYDDNANLNESERQAALVDEMRRREMLRRNVVRDPTLSAPPTGPNLQRPGLQMPVTQTAPQTAAPAPQVAAQSGADMQNWYRQFSASQVPAVDVGADLAAPIEHRQYTRAELQRNPALARRLQDAANNGEIVIGNTALSSNIMVYPGRGEGAARNQPHTPSGIYFPRNPNNRQDIVPGGGFGLAIDPRVTEPNSVRQRPAAPSAEQTMQNVVRANGGGTRAQGPLLNPGQTAPTQQGGMQNAIAQALGGTVSSGQRTTEHNREVGGAANSMHLTNEAVDITVPQALAGMDPRQAEQAVRQQLAQTFPGQQFSEVIHEGDHIHIGWRPEGGTQQDSAQGPAPELQQIFQAAASGPEGAGFVVQQLQQQRAQAVALFQAAQRAGVADQMMEARNSIYAIDTQTLAAHGAGAAMTLGYTGNTERWSQFFQETTGHSLTFQPYSDGSYEIVIDGAPQGRQTRQELLQNALSMVDADFRTRMTARQDSDYEAARDSGYRRVEAYETALFRGMTDIEVAQIRAEAAQRTGSQNVEFQDIGDGKTIAVYTNAAGQRVASLVQINQRRSPTTGGGNGQQQDVLEFGPETAWGQ